MARSRRARRWLLILSVLAVLLLIGGWWVNRQLEPNRLTATVLRKAGESLQLKLVFQGQPDYALKPEPRLLVPNLEVSGLDGKVFLSAKRAEISLPWSTITGDEPVITRVELDAPTLDLPGLRAWIASLPKTPFKLPTLNKGLQISDGSVQGDGYAIHALALELPRLKTGEPAKISAQGGFVQEKTEIQFKLELHLATPGLDSDFVAQGSGALQQTPKPLPFQLQAAGHYLSNDAALSIDAGKLELHGASPLPNLTGAGKLVVAEQMRLDFEGLLQDWPKDWPALPQPLAANSSKLPLRLAYLGKPDFSDPIALTVNRDQTSLQASVRVPEIRQWLDAPPGSPLPPLNGKLSTPSLAFDGVELRGVEIEISDSVSPAAVKP
jgi:hypothetical protein